VESADTRFLTPGLKIGKNAIGFVGLSCSREHVTEQSSFCGRIKAPLAAATASTTFRT